MLLTVGGIVIDSLTSNVVLLVIARSEITATFLAGVAYLLLSNPQTMLKLRYKVYLVFNSTKDIRIALASHLLYMVTCLNKSLHLYPPITGSMVRLIADSGVIIA